MRFDLAAAFQRQARQLQEKLLEPFKVASRHARLSCALKSFFTHKGEGIERILAGDKYHQPSVTHEGCAQCFCDRFAVVENWDWLHWDGSTWSRKPDTETLARQVQ